MIHPTVRALLVLAVASAACAETATAARPDDDEVMRANAATAHATPASMATASQTFGKGRAGEHKSMLHHH